MRWCGLSLPHQCPDEVWPRSCMIGTSWSLHTCYNIGLTLPLWSSNPFHRMLLTESCGMLSSAHLTAAHIPGCSWFNNLSPYSHYIWCWLPRHIALDVVLKTNHGISICMPSYSLTLSRHLNLLTPILFVGIYLWKGMSKKQPHSVHFLLRI